METKGHTHFQLRLVGLFKYVCPFVTTSIKGLKNTTDRAGKFKFSGTKNSMYWGINPPQKGNSPYILVFCDPPAWKYQR